MAGTDLPGYEYTPTGGPLTVIDFTEPLADDPKFMPRVRARDVFGGKGRRQRNSDYQEEVSDLTHDFVPGAELDLVITMMQDHVLEGGTFFFIEDRINFPLVKVEVEMLDQDFDFDRTFLSLKRFRFRIAVRKVIS